MNGDGANADSDNEIEITFDISSIAPLAAHRSFEVSTDDGRLIRLQQTTAPDVFVMTRENSYPLLLRSRENSRPAA